MNTDISQGSVATHLVLGGVFKYSFVTNFLLHLTFKKIWKSVNIWWSYGQEFGVLFFWGTEYLRLLLVASLLILDYGATASSNPTLLSSYVWSSILTPWYIDIASHIASLVCFSNTFCSQSPWHCRLHTCNTFTWFLTFDGFCGNGYFSHLKATCTGIIGIWPDLLELFRATMGYKQVRQGPQGCFQHGSLRLVFSHGLLRRERWCLINRQVYDYF